MTAPAPGVRRGRLLQPRVALPIVAAAIIGVALLTPEATSGRTGDARLSSRSTLPQGASVLYELSARLGWRPERRYTDSIAQGETTSVHVILDPPIALRATETHQVLEGVRRGAALVYVFGDGPMADSLGLRALPRNSGSLVPEDTTSCPRRGESVLTSGVPFWLDGQTFILAVQWKGAPPPGRVTLATIRPTLGTASGRELPAAVGFPMGRGRVVVMTDPDLLRNDVLRVCRWGAGVAAVRALEYASAGAPGGARRQRLVFDEYHQGYGDQPGTMRGIVRYLARSSSGHLVLQLAGAGLVLLLAAGPRLLPPRAVERIERRSPLEHVDALARAYRAVGATRTATARLLHGVRRRVEHALGARGATPSPEAFLDWAITRAPARAGDVELVRQALATPVSRHDLEGVGTALRRIEASLTFYVRSS